MDEVTEKVTLPSIVFSLGDIIRGALVAEMKRNPMFSVTINNIIKPVLTTMAMGGAFKGDMANVYTNKELLPFEKFLFFAMALAAHQIENADDEMKVELDREVKKLHDAIGKYLEGKEA